jgi:flagellar biosynthesis protein FlhF
MSAPTPRPTPGTCYKFTVANAHEAAAAIRDRLGEHARVLSVRAVEPNGLRSLWAAPRLEVIAALDTPAAPASSAPAAPAPAAPSARLSAEPPAARRELAPLLRRAGLSEAILARLERAPAWASLQELPLHRAFVEAGRLLRTMAAPRPVSLPLSRAAFFGPAGTGRTTALCKWLSAEVARRARLGHVVTVEFDHPVSRGPLPVVCEALGVPLAHFPAATRPATPGGFVYFDLPGLALRDAAANAPLAEFLEREQIRERVLVLNAAYGPATLRAGYARGRELGATHVVFTHLDELTQWGGLWDYLVDGGLEPLFLSTGPSLTGECADDVLDALMRRTLPLLPDPAGGDTEEDAA